MGFSLSRHPHPNPLPIGWGEGEDGRFEAFETSVEMRTSLNKCSMAMGAGLVEFMSEYMVFMKREFYCLAWSEAGGGFARLVVGLFCLMALAALAEGRETLNFNPDWKFTKEDDTDAAQPGFNDDGGWQTVSAPHTFNDTDTFDHWSLPGHRGEQQQWSGRTWYRKTFTAPASFRGKKIYAGIRGGAAGGGSLFEREISGREQDGFHAVLDLT